MIEQVGLISRVEHGRAWVTCRPAVCRVCEEGRGCGAGVFGGLLSRSPSRFAISRVGGMKPGDRVVLGLDERRLLSGALRLYGLPLAGLMAGALAGGAAGGAGNDVAVLVGASSGLVIALWGLRQAIGRVPEPVFLRHCGGGDR